MTIDWTDETLRTLDDLAKTAFPPEAGITKDSLKRLVRKGKLVAYRPGKEYLSTLAEVWAMVQATQISYAAPPKPTSPVPNPLGLTEMELARFSAEAALDELLKKKPIRPVNEKERARAAEAHRLMIQDRRRARARAKYRKDKEARLKAAELPSNIESDRLALRDDCDF